MLWGRREPIPVNPYQPVVSRNAGGHWRGLFALPDGGDMATTHLPANAGVTCWACLWLASTALYRSCTNSPSCVSISGDIRERSR